MSPFPIRPAVARYSSEGMRYHIAREHKSSTLSDDSLGDLLVRHSRLHQDKITEHYHEAATAPRKMQSKEVFKQAEDMSYGDIVAHLTKSESHNLPDDYGSHGFNTLLQVHQMQHEHPSEDDHEHWSMAYAANPAADEEIISQDRLDRLRTAWKQKEYSRRASARYSIPYPPPDPDFIPLTEDIAWEDMNHDDQ